MSLNDQSGTRGGDPEGDRRARDRAGDITDRVRALYDRFPYPDIDGQVRADGFLELLLSYVERARRPPPIRVLDAGCGTGSGIVSVARMHPNARCVGFDISAGALERARTSVQAAGLDNLHLLAADLMNADSLPRADADADGRPGYDVVYASGVIHHLADPLAGLRNLARLLAEDGVLVLMVYSTWARQPVFRFARAMDILWPDRDDFATRVPMARALLAELGDSPVTAPPWRDGPVVPDNELIDRYLHVNDRGYTVREFFELIEQAGLTFLRWLEPRAWDARSLMGEGRASELLTALPARQRYEVLDMLFDHPSLTAIVGRTGAQLRPLLTMSSLAEATIAWNPQAALRSTVRQMIGTMVVSDVEVQVRLLAPYRLDGIHAALAQACGRPTPGRELVAAARQLSPARGTRASNEQAFSALAELLNREILFVP